MAKQSSKSSIIIIAILLIVLLVVRGFRSCNKLFIDNGRDSTVKTQSLENSRLADWRKRTLVYTKHARCRMQCRNISESEVESIQKAGTVNYTKSDLHDTPCAAFAVEGNTVDGQKVRIVFGACEKVTTVITCIDIGEEHACNCD